MQVLQSRIPIIFLKAGYKNLTSNISEVNSHYHPLMCYCLTSTTMSDVRIWACSELIANGSKFGGYSNLNSCSRQLPSKWQLLHLQEPHFNHFFTSRSSRKVFIPNICDCNISPAFWEKTRLWMFMNLMTIWPITALLRKNGFVYVNYFWYCQAQVDAVMQLSLSACFVFLQHFWCCPVLKSSSKIYSPKFFGVPMAESLQSKNAVKTISSVMLIVRMVPLLFNELIENYRDRPMLHFWQRKYRRLVNLLIPDWSAFKTSELIMSVNKQRWKIQYIFMKD